MANKEIREIEIRVDTEGIDRARSKIKALEADYNKAQRKANRGSWIGSGKGYKVATPYESSRDKAERYRRRRENDEAYRLLQRQKTLDYAQRNIKGIRGRDPKMLNAQNSMFATGMKTPAMLKAEKDFSKYVTNKTGLKATGSKFGRKTIGVDVNPKIAEDEKLLNAWLSAKDAHNKKIEMAKAKEAKASERLARATEKEAAQAEARAIKGMMDSNLHAGEQQQRDYFARAKSNMAKYNERIKTDKRDAQSRAEREKKEWDKLAKAPLELRNSIGSLATVATQAVGELTMFAGAITMVGFMGAAAFQKLMAVGDAFGTVEKNFLVGAGFRNSLIQKGGISAVAGFDRANALNMRYTGLDQMSSAAMMARAGTQIREMQGTVNERNLSNLSLAASGAAAITGDTADKTMSKILEVAKKGKGTEKLGLAELKLTKNMDENLTIIADAIKKDPIAGAILRRGNVDTAMQRIRSAPQQLLGGLLKEHPEQINRIFNRVGDSIFKAASSDKVIQAWSKTLTNMENVVKVVFTDKNMEEAAIGAARWAAELTVWGGNLILATKWFLTNSDSIIDGIKKIGSVWLAVQAIKTGVGIGKVLADIHNLFSSINVFSTSAPTAIASFAGAVTMLTGGLIMAIWDAKTGIDNAEKWGVGKTNAGISSFLGGTNSGWYGATTNATKWGLMGAGIGSIVPGIGTAVGGFVGAGVGGILGYVGGKNLAQSAHESMYGVKPIEPVRNLLAPQMTGTLPGVNYAPSQTSGNGSAWNNPNQKVFVIHGDVNVDSKLHLSEEWMIGSGGEIGGYN